MRLSGNGAGPALRQLSDYPHPYPALRDLQKEVIRHADTTLFLADSHNHGVEKRKPRRFRINANVYPHRKYCSEQRTSHRPPPSEPRGSEGHSQIKFVAPWL